MLLAGRNGQSVRLTPVGYEAELADVTAEVADDWIVIEGDVATSQGDWTFRDSSLLAAEWLRLGEWLTDVAVFKVPATGPDEDPTLRFLEPSLAFSVAAWAEDGVNLRVHLTHLAAPPWQDIEDKLNTWAFFVELTVRVEDLRTAVADLNRAAETFPPRTRKT